MLHQIITTADGSHSLFIPALNEHYHSTNGALQEALHVFIGAGLKYVAEKFSRTCINVLEIGFGTGLNALLTLLEAQNRKMPVFYEAVEKYALPATTVARLNYTTLIPPENSPYFSKIHEAKWNEETLVAGNSPTSYTLLKKLQDLSDYRPCRMFDVIYFDAFAPAVQPELWTTAVFKKLHGCLNTGGILVTYSAKGTVKTALREAGFLVERLPGAAGKRHMLRAHVKPQDKML
ncbi:MAG: tRNA (5-methylaminomethyl-2-thiouridine)(34)-methyltransferase MnmD [Prevotellaceae bacterium]|jgi:tRNA U34 5-methylaminomethyl-2-thiouridine-forming methyltransferase MnmC|nr:tRNA (5-methylaminomethyl-2-thiouridine)(34)-methyltransferase MnmD [Prevotellaceae bacterium]